ncbi:MAG: hypothetical protein CL949_01810 [Erythrobacter sp.]|nr:hypothetical protein [Erythrobacter sp.]|tara:strand:+ start:159 stop:407 length:249 start_codon:yes stop_codon:yes gene_type:complete
MMVALSVEQEGRFDPAAWLARYVELGGGYSVVGDAIWLHWLLSVAVDEAAIQAHERVLRGRPDWRNAVKALIMQRVAREVVE